MNPKKKTKLKRCAKRIKWYAEQMEGAGNVHEVLRLALLIQGQLGAISATTR